MNWGNGILLIYISVLINFSGPIQCTLYILIARTMHGKRFVRRLVRMDFFLNSDSV